jgi:dihydrofolate reductase
MAKLIVIAMTSVDGYYEGPGGAGDLEPAQVDDGFNAYNADAVARAAVVVIGHRSFRDFSSYWPERETAEDASDAERRFATSYNPLPKVVASRDPSSVRVPDQWRENTRVVSDDIAREVARLKEQADDDVLIWGSRDLWTQLWSAGLVDELHLVSGTGTAGAGTPVFPDDPGVGLTALETRLLPDSRCVLTTYAVSRVGS